MDVGKYIKCPFPYPGGKGKMVEEILYHMDDSYDIYVEPFGGSGAVLLNKEPHPIEIYNDRNGGVYAFYRCLQDDELYHELLERLETTVCSRDMFKFSLNTWQGCNDLVEKAARWFYVQRHCHGGKGTSFGMSKSPKAPKAIRYFNSLKWLPVIHHRLKNVVVENQDAFEIMRYYDGPGSVMYIDPPYYNTAKDAYRLVMDETQHRLLLDLIESMEAKIIVSSYSNELYDSYIWDEVDEVVHPMSIDNKKNGFVKELLYIKE